MTTTAANITDGQIDIALNRWHGDSHSITVQREDECIAECARVISEAEAQS